MLLIHSEFEMRQIIIDTVKAKFYTLFVAII